MWRVVQLLHCVVTISEFGWWDADLSTDGRWCFVVLWVVPRVSASTVRWPLLKQGLEDACPSAVGQFLPSPSPPVLTSKNMFLLQVCSSDRTGLLHGTISLSLQFGLDHSLPLSLLARPELFQLSVKWVSMVHIIILCFCSKAWREIFSACGVIGFHCVPSGTMSSFLLTISTFWPWCDRCCKEVVGVGIVYPQSESVNKSWWQSC